MLKLLIYIYVLTLTIINSSHASDSRFVKIDLGDKVITESVLKRLEGTSITFVYKNSNILLVETEDMPIFQGVYNESIQEILPPERTQVINLNLLEKYKDRLTKEGIAFRQLEVEGQIYLLLDRGEDFMQSHIIKYELYESR